MPDKRILVVLDADSTLFRQEVIELIADQAGREKEVRAATEAAMRGETDFADSLRSRVAALAGVSEEALGFVRDRVDITPGARELIAAVHERNGVVGVVSGGFHEILDALLPPLAIDHWRANRLGVRDGVLTGEVDEPIIDAAAKAATLQEWAQQYGVSPEKTLAVGDGANDLEMMAVAACGVAFNAKPLVRERADVVIERVDLSEVIRFLH